MAEGLAGRHGGTRMFFRTVELTRCTTRVNVINAMIRRRGHTEETIPSPCRRHIDPDGRLRGTRYRPHLYRMSGRHKIESRLIKNFTVWKIYFRSKTTFEPQLTGAETDRRLSVWSDIIANPTASTSAGEHRSANNEVAKSSKNRPTEIFEQYL